MEELKKLEKYFLKKKLEIREKKTVTAIYHDNLQLFSINSIRNKVGVGMVMNFTFNILKEKKEVFDDIEGVDIKKTPFINGVTEEDILQILKDNDLVHESKELTVFDEVQENYTLEVVTNKDGKTVEYRSNLPTEIHIVQAVFKSNEYINKGLKLSKKDIVFDLGGNIGCFSCEVFDRVKKVITFEPEEVNFMFLQNNLKRNKADNVEAHKSAVVGNSDEQRNLYLGKVPYYYSFLVTNNRKPVKVQCININDLIEEYNPTKMKIDIEGSELEVMLGIKDFKKVNQIIFEYNFDMNHDLKSGYENFTKLRKHLKKHGFDVSDMKKDLKRNWNMVFLVNRK